MHKKFTLIAINLLAIGSIEATAQDITEAYNLSNLTVKGTARSMGFGNALGSIGADFSTTSVNPAGLGIYRSSEFTLTPTLRMNGASSAYLGTTTLDNNARFNFSNFGLVFTDAAKGKRYDRRKWKVVSFAFGMNRVADFNRNYTYSGVNNNNSMSQYFEADANMYPADALSQTAQSYPGYIGYQGYLLNYDTGGSGVFYSVLPIGGALRQTKTVKERGRINEYTLSLGGNYQEKLMLGATLGIPSFKYNLNSSYSESLASSFSGSNPNSFNYFRYDQSLSLSGTGLNLKLGAIYKVSNKFRFGAAFHTPTVYAITDSYTPGITSSFGSTTYQANASNQLTASNQFNYQYISPWRGILSASYIVKGKGFITADYEYIGYSGMRYIYPTSDGAGGNYASAESDMNNAIKATYKSTSNVRVGLEALLTKYIMARAGFGYYSNPYKTSDVNGQRMDLSAGVGFRGEHFFADIALVNSSYKMSVQPYTLDYNYIVTGNISAAPTSITTYSLNTIAVTVGTKF